MGSSPSKLLSILLVVGAALAMSALSRPDQADAAKVVDGLPPATAEHPSECSRFHSAAKWRRLARAQRRGDRAGRRKAARRARTMHRRHDRCHQALEGGEEQQLQEEEEQPLQEEEEQPLQEEEEQQLQEEEEQPLQEEEAQPLQEEEEQPLQEEEEQPLQEEEEQPLLEEERLRREHTVSEQYFGTTVGFLRNNSVDPHPLLGSIRDAGLREARLSGLWHTIERTAPVDGRHTYDWGHLDEKVRLLASYDLRLYSLLVWGARWASPYPAHPQAWKFAPKPEFYDDWAEWAAAMAKRYGRDGAFWTAHPELPYLPIQSYEVWNETNYSVFSFPEEPELYADLYLRTYRKIKQVDPAARVVFTAHSSTGFADWLARAYAAEPELRDVVDVIAVHIYGGTPPGGFAKLGVMRAAIDRIAGPGVEIDISEDGMQAWPQWDAVRASYLSEIALGVPRSGCGVTKYMLYTWWTNEEDPLNPDHWFGISDLQGNLRPSGEAFVEATRQMQGLGAQPVPWEPLPIC